jgi:hypothetical protein
MQAVQGDFLHETRKIIRQLGDIEYINATIKKMQAVEPNITHCGKIPQASVQLLNFQSN